MTDPERARLDELERRIARLEAVISRLPVFRYWLGSPG